MHLDSIAATMSDPLVSIVLPTYNGSKFLEKSIRSCLDQSYSNFELILSDDASTDSTPEIVAQFERMDSRIRSVRHTSNLGLPSALNSGFAISRGQFLTWTSDDNLYRPNAISVLVNFMKTHPQLDIVYAGFSFIDDEGTVLGHQAALPFQDLPYRNTVGACFLYRREVYEKLHGYDVDASLVEDYDFWLRGFELFRFHALPENFYFYRVHRASSSHRDTHRIKLATRRILEKHLEGWGRRNRSLAYWRIARDAADMGDSRTASSFMRKAILTYPWSLLRKTALITSAALILGQANFQKLKAIFKSSPVAR